MRTAAERKKDKEIAERVRAGTWWPFDRVDATLLEKLHRQSVKEQQTQKEQALL